MSNTNHSNPAGSDPPSPDDLSAALDACIEKLLCGSGVDPACPSTLHIHMSEVDVTPDPKGEALRRTEEDINDASRRAAETVANTNAPEVVHTPDAIPYDAVEVKDIAAPVIDAVGPALEAQAKQAREARTAIAAEVGKGNKASKDAIEAYTKAGGLALDAARKNFYRAAVKYHALALGGLIVGTTGYLGGVIDARGFFVNILAAAFVYGAAKVAKK